MEKTTQPVTTLDDYINEQTERDPAFAEALEEAGTQIDFGLWVAHLRESRGWTQTHLADRIGMAQSAVARIERGGRMPSLHTAQRFARALNAAVIINPDGDVCLMDCKPKPTTAPADTSD
jgi:ribosome-binding protein aMBF1 (putative translation factor)